MREGENLVRHFCNDPELTAFNIRQMTPKNLAVVFAPTIMRDHSLEREMTDMHAKNAAVQYVIENSHEIFSTV